MFTGNGAARSVCLALLTGISVNAQRSSPPLTPIQASVGRVPLYFEENRGQTDPRARYIARGPNQIAFVTQDGLTFSGGGKAIAMRIVDAAPNAAMQAEGEVKGVSNYYLGKSAVSGVRHFSSVRVTDIRPGIDILYHGSDKNLEYDLVIRPGADPNKLRIRFEGGPAPQLGENGDLVFRADSGELRQHAPIVWQETGDQRRENRVQVCALGVEGGPASTVPV
jgi:hypothetical protein